MKANLLNTFELQIFGKTFSRQLARNGETVEKLSH